MKYKWSIIVAFLTLIVYLAGFHDKPVCLFIKTHAGGVHKINAEVVRTDEAKRLGLMGRQELREGKGMLFVYEDEPDPVIWMKGMNFPIDIVFIGRDFEIEHIENSAAPCQTALDRECSRYRSALPASYVLELPAGYVKRHGIELKDKVVLPSGI